MEYSVDPSRKALYKRITLADYKAKTTKTLDEPLRLSLNQLPSLPGVYQFFNTTNQLLYVGKAKDLKKRVWSYFKGRNHSPWTKLMIDEIASLNVTTVSTELEALFLENSFIKSLKPIYNIQLKDDKTYPYLKVTNEAFPRFSLTRKVYNDKARYFGPYISAMYLRGLLALLQQLYGVRTAKPRSYESISSVPGQIGLGARNLDNQEVYNANVAAALKFIESPQPKMEAIIKERMHEAAQKEQFELAAKLRNQLKGLEQLRAEQSIESPTFMSRDYIGFAELGNLVGVHILMEREGKIVTNRQFLFTNSANKPLDRGEIITYIYLSGIVIPRQLITTPFNDSAPLGKLFSQQAGHGVKILTPSRGALYKKVQMAMENAAYQLQLECLKKSRRTEALQSLATLLALPKIPKRIEACDISNLGATEIVGATIVFIDGQPAKNEYRKYKIQTPKGQDDFASMRELVFRRLKNKDRPLPDLLLIDGGKGQLSAALDAIKLAGATVPVLALAKKEELIYLPNQSEPIRLQNNDPARLLLEAVRNEVHRFVLSFHRLRRTNSFLSK